MHKTLEAVYEDISLGEDSQREFKENIHNIKASPVSRES